MKVLFLDVPNNYTVQFVYPNSSDYTETYRNDGVVEAQWIQIIDPNYPPAPVSGSFSPDQQEVITVDDSVEVSVGDSALVEPFFSLLLSKVKKRKLYELEQAWRNSVYSSFTVESTGNRYGVDQEALMNFNMQATDIVMFPEDYPETTMIYWRTINNGVVPHTLAQFKEVCKALRQHLRGNIEKLWTLQSQVNQATTIEEVKAIRW